jgi:hypothetical protein
MDSKSEDRSGEDKKLQTLHSIILRFPGPEYYTPQKQAILTKILYDKIKSTQIGREMLTNGKPRNPVQEFIISFLDVRETFRHYFSKIEIYNQGTTPDSNKGDSNNDRLNKEGKKRKSEDQHEQKKTYLPCSICGRNNHDKKTCSLESHPDSNAENGVAFKDSANGKLWKINPKGGDFGTVHPHFRLDGTPRLTNPNIPQRRVEGKPSLEILSSHVKRLSQSDLSKSDFLKITISLVQPKANATG